MFFSFLINEKGWRIRKIQSFEKGEKEFMFLPFLQAFFGVFDGHGGASAAEFAAKNLEKNILNELEKSNEIEVAVKNGYLTTDSEFLNKDVRGGACSVTALIKNGNLVASNAGDCRALLSRGGSAVALTSDHRPGLREDERERIEKLVIIRHMYIFSSTNLPVSCEKNLILMLLCDGLCRVVLLKSVTVFGESWDH